MTPLMQVTTEVLHNEADASRRVNELASLGFNVACQQLNLLAWQVTYWTVLES